MTLEAVVLRLEGVLFRTADAFRVSVNEVLAEAGFEHHIDSETFALQFGHYICKERFLNYANQFLRRRRRSEDLETLLEITYRRIIVTAERTFSAKPPPPQDGAIELVRTLRGSGLKIAVLTSINSEFSRGLVEQTFGKVEVCGASNFKNEWTGAALERSKDALGNALKIVKRPAQNCLALQSSSYGLAAAESLGVPSIAIIGQSSLNGGLYGARAVVDGFFDLSPLADAETHQKNGDSLLRALCELHAAGSKNSDRSNAMQVRQILKDKGSAVKSVYPTDTILFVAERLNQEKVGAMVAISAQGELEGIISERDIVRGLTVHGADLLAMPVSNIMTRSVITCSPADSIFAVAKVMTKRRIRHLPVSERGELVGLISIGDVLSSRLEEVQLEADVLRDYTIALR